MMQWAMLMTVDGFAVAVCTGLLAHFKREEDEMMISGKLDEELSRMSDIADHRACTASPAHAKPVHVWPNTRADAHVAQSLTGCSGLRRRG